MTDEDSVVDSVKEVYGKDYNIFTYNIDRYKINAQGGGYNQGLEVLRELYISTYCV